MPGCSVQCCKNWNGKTKNQNIKYFKFPQDPDLSKEWSKACDNDKIHNLKDGTLSIFGVLFFFSFLITSFSS